MKKIIAYILLSVVLVACNDSFLERYPLDTLTNETYWKSENDLKAYVAGLYTIFDGETVWDDDNSDNQAPSAYNEVAASKHAVSTGTWSWSNLRKYNFFLENYNSSDVIPTEIKNKYKGMVQFFRAMFTYGRIKTYGDIPYSTKVLTTNDKDVLFGKRVPRAEVMKIVLQDLNDAVAYIPPTAGKEGELTKWAALALKARICLHEGTFRKYHKIDGADEFIKEAAAAAKEIIEKGGFVIYNTGKPNEYYRKLFVQLSLKGNSEGILHKKYEAEVKGHNFIRYMVNSTRNGLTKDFVNDYLCTDGKPIGSSPLYKGDDQLTDEFSNRNPRLPLAKGQGSSTTTGYHVIKMYDNDEVAKYSNAETDLHLFRYAETLLIYAEAKAELGEANQAVIDQTINELRKRVGMPDMKIAELVRDLASDMTSGAGYLDQEVSVLLEEIRRERRVELACEGFRYDDLMRWRAGKFLQKTVLGAKWDAFKDQVDTKGEKIYDGKVAGPDIKVDANGYIDLYQGQLENRTFDPAKHYYRSIPLEEITLNSQLT